jgi:deoxyribodipyrimidine photolyase
VVIGESYPAPIVDHFEARDAAIAAYEAARGRTSS